MFLLQYGNESDKFIGYDLHDDLSKYQDDYNIYGTDLYTAKAVNIIQNHNEDTPLFLMLSQIATHSGEESDRLQAPPDEIAKFDYITDEEKRIFAGKSTFNIFVQIYNYVTLTGL